MTGNGPWAQGTVRNPVHGPGARNISNGSKGRDRGKYPKTGPGARGQGRRAGTENPKARGGKEGGRGRREGVGEGGRKGEGGIDKDSSYERTTTPEMVPYIWSSNALNVAYAYIATHWP